MTIISALGAIDGGLTGITGVPMTTTSALTTIARHPGAVSGALQTISTLPAAITGTVEITIGMPTMTNSFQGTAPDIRMTAQQVGIWT